MDLVIDPPQAVGSIRIGMPFEEALQLVRGIEGFRPQAPTGGYMSPGFAHFDSGMSISIGADRGGAVEAIEVYRPGQGVNVLFRNIEIFAEEADEVIRLLAGEVEVVVEDNGLRVVAPQLLLALARDVLPGAGDDESGRYFESALIATPGYYGDLL